MGGIRVSMYPCPNPQICGVRQHREADNCRAASRLSSSHSRVPISSIPPSATPIPSSEREQEEFLAQGGGIETTYFDSGAINSEFWYGANGGPSREGGPSSRLWYESGQIRYEGWNQNWRFHREDGPSLQEWNEDGQITRESWSVNGEQHREDGPAVTVWNDSGEIESQLWYLNDTEYTFTEFKQQLVAVEAQRAGFTEEMSRAWAGIE